MVLQDKEEDKEENHLLVEQKHICYENTTEPRRATWISSHQIRYYVSRQVGLSQGRQAGERRVEGHGTFLRQNETFPACLPTDHEHF